MRNQLAGSLRQCCHKLEVDKQEGRVALFELLINTPAVGNLIREGKPTSCRMLFKPQQVGMITFQQSYQQRVGKGVCDVAVSDTIVNMPSGASYRAYKSVTLNSHSLWLDKAFTPHPT